MTYVADHPERRRGRWLLAAIAAGLVALLGLMLAASPAEPLSTRLPVPTGISAPACPTPKVTA